MFDLFSKKTRDHVLCCGLGAIASCDPGIVAGQSQGAQVDETSNLRRFERWQNHRRFDWRTEHLSAAGGTGAGTWYPAGQAQTLPLPDRGFTLVTTNRPLPVASGSMYRFNGYDKRLERQMAAVLLFMEALEGHFSKWRYDVIAHRR